MQMLYSARVLQCMRFRCECMTAVPDWLEGFPVGAEAETGSDFTIA